MNLLAAVIIALWVALPTYIPNNVAVLAGGGQPIDGGRTFRGARLLGDGKTWRGAIAGIAGGAMIALLLNAMHSQLTGILGIDMPVFPAAIVIAFPTGAILGDILASFVKRRTGRERGSVFPLVDQLDFLLVALLFGLLVRPDWMIEVFTPLILVVVLLLTPLLHVSTNIVAYLLGLKNEPW